MKETEISTRWIDRYGEEELNETELQVFTMHLQANPLLRTETVIDAKLNRFLSDHDTIEMMEKIRQVACRPYLYNRKLAAWLVAASILSLLTFGTTYFLLRTDPVTMSRFSSPGEPPDRRMGSEVKMVYRQIMDGRKISDISPVSRREMAVKPLICDSYKPMTEFELLVGAVTRAGLLKVVSPKAELTIIRGQSVEFRWEGVNSFSPVNIIVLDNSGKRVRCFQVKRSDRSFTMETAALEKGLYYWKILAEDEIITLGKLIVKQ
jgi:hypothetical protein